MKDERYQIIIGNKAFPLVFRNVNLNFEIQQVWDDSILSVSVHNEVVVVLTPYLPPPEELSKPTQGNRL